MQTSEQTPTRQPAGIKNRRSLAAIAVLAAAIFVTGAALVVWNSNTEEFAGTAMTDREVVDAFVAARDTGDVETTDAMLAQDAQINDDNQATDRLAYYDMVAWLGALEWNWELLDCTEEAYGANGTAMDCTYEHSNAWSRALGLEPINDRGTMLFTVEDGEVTSFVHKFNHTTFSPQVWEVFGTWVHKNHPELVGAILSDGCCTSIRTSTANDVWRSLTEEYVAELDS